MNLPLISDFQCVPSGPSSVLLTPGFAVVGVGSTQPTIALLANLISEQQLTPSQVAYDVSDPTIATVDVNGNVTGVAPGVAFVGATFNNMTGYATIIVQPVVNGSYCNNEPVGTYIALDTSISMMAQGFDGTFSTPLSVAKFLAKQLANRLNINKDVMGVISFDADPDLLLSLSQDPPTIESAITGAMPQISNMDYTSINHGLRLAMQMVRQCSTCVRKVVVLISDGQSEADLAAMGGMMSTAAIFEEAAAFKSRGGIIIVVGLNAANNAYTFLRTLATPGYFINVLPNQVGEAEAILLNLPTLYCAQEPAGYVLNYFPQDGGFVFDNLY